MMIIWIIVSILLFSIIVIIHELWHFWTARFFWVKVEEFWIWIPPKAKKLFKDKYWTIYTLNWLPLWGFVRLKWETGWQLIDKKDKEALINIAPWKQMIIVLAWVFMNFLLAFIIFSILFFIWIKPIWINSKIETDLDLKLIPTYEQAIESWLLIKKSWIILTPVKWSIAEESWLKEWDILLKINWIDIKSSEQVIKIIEENKGKEVSLLINLKEIKITIPETWKIWSYLSDNVEYNENFEYNFWFFPAIKYWFLETYNEALITFEWLKYLVKKIAYPETPEERTEAIQTVSWPIWIVNFITSSLSAGIIFFLIIWAIISINLWIFNLLPIPALDWWRFIFIFLNWILLKITWKKIIWENLEWLVHLTFFVFLIALSIIIAYNDIIKIINN